MGTKYVGEGLYGLRPRVWQSGMTVAQGEIVTSPLDWEEYQRIAATGAGTTDPADDTANYIARSYRRVTAIVGPGAPQALVNTSQLFNGSQQVAMTLAADTRTRMLSLSGRGHLRFLACAQKSATQRTRRTEVVIDGRSVYDTAVAYLSAQSFVLLAGSMAGGMVSTTFIPSYSALPTADIPFKRSLEIWITPAGGSDTAVSFSLHYMFEPEA